MSFLRLWRDNQHTSSAAQLTVIALPVLPVEVGQVAVLIPPCTVVPQGTAAESHIIVPVPRCELPATVVGPCIP